MRSLRTNATLTAAAPSFRRSGWCGMCASVAGQEKLEDRPEQGLDLIQ